MNIKVIGLQNLDFVTKDGNHIKGINVYAMFPDKKIQGFRCEKFYISQEIVLPKGGIQVNDTIDLVFDFKGKIESISKVE